MNDIHSEIKVGLQYLTYHVKGIFSTNYKILYPFIIEYCKKNNLRILEKNKCILLLLLEQLVSLSSTC